jgi:translation initiation factor IF-2
MKVSELAEQLKTTDEMILKTLKSLRLKSRDSAQELSGAVVSVVRSEMLRSAKLSPQIPAQTPAKPAQPEESPPAKTLAKGTKAVVPPPEETEPKIKRAAPLNAQKTVEAAVLSVKEKKDTGRSSAKAKVKIGKEPVITLKPLVRKKKKLSTVTKEEINPEASQEASSLVPGEQSLSPSFPGTASVAPPGSGTARLSPGGEGAVVSEKLADLEVNLPISVKDFGAKIQQKPSLVLKQLMRMGLLAHINQSLDGDVINKLAQAFGFNLVKIKTQEEQLIDDHKHEEGDPSLLRPRAPVVTFMGHVDHGKTSLLDRIRKTKVTDTEYGGITQHIGAYSVQLPKGRITFLDTPGHEAFTAMRARGAHITDIVVLVVAADEGVMPQTDEALDHARAAGVPVVVALNKIDRKNADPDRVKKQLSERGLTPEDWGGKTIVAGVSALTGEGVDNLLEMILLEAELLELKANADKRASGIVVDAHLSAGKGAVTTLIVQSGTLREGDMIVVGPLYGRIRAIHDDRRRPLKEAGPSMPIEVLGLSHVPAAGEIFYIAEDERHARDIAQKRQEQIKNKRLQMTSRVTLEDLYAQVQEGAIKELNVILKADVQGSLEALRDSLEKIPSDKVRIHFIHSGVGDVKTSDVLLAVVSKAVIIAFHVDIDMQAKEELEKEPVDVRQYRIIYDAVNDVRNALEGLLEAKTKKKFLGRVEIRQVFKLSKQGIVAGCYVMKGNVRRKDHVDIVRNGEIICSTTITTLKRFKDEVREVGEGMECGITLGKFDQFQAGDTLEIYEIERIAQKL